MTDQLDQAQAVEFHDSLQWQTMSYQELAKFQINQKHLCMPWDVFHEAVEKTIGYPVYSHEFATNFESIKSKISAATSPESTSCN